MPGFYQERWRVYIELMFARYYANADPPSPLPRVRWMLKEQEYPDHFCYRMAKVIAEYYSDQKPRLEKIVLNLEDEVG